MNSDHSSSWIRRFGRSKSDAQSPDEQLNASPPPSAPIAPPSPGNPSVRTSEGTTPPKKAWEQHYRNFLTKRLLGQSPSRSTPTTDEDSSGRSGKGSRRLLFRTRSGSKRELIPPAAGLPDMPNLAQSSSNEDMAVRGGNFFASVFSRERTGSSDNSSTSHAPAVQQRRIKSMDTLDSTLRGGHDKTYSPRNQRFLVKSYADDRPVHGGETSPTVTKRHIPAALSGSQLQTSTQPQAAVASKPAAASQKSKSREMKKAFTEFHNSQQFSLDSSSAYLGDDPSIRQSTYLTMPKRTSVGAQSERNLASLLLKKESSSLPAIEEVVVATKSTRILKPVQGPESWESGRRYLIAPAALATCPLSVLSTLSKTQTYVEDYTTSAFGVIDLGVATAKYVGPKHHDWTSCHFVLKQNYLMEYSVDGSLTAAPRGFAHLQYARAYPHSDFPNALELEFYASPCARSDKRVLFIRVTNREDRDRWIMCLNDAAQLTIKDLYDYDEDNVFGKGRYAMVYPARRRLGGEDEEDDSTTKKEYHCALKVMDKNEFWRRVVKGMERADTIVRETSVQATLTAKCTILGTFLQIRGIFETSHHFVIEMELLEGTDLFQHVSQKSVIEEDEEAHIMCDILTSLDAMARIGLAHRDIKPANILMCAREKSGVSVKVADFGMSGFACVDGKLRGRCGTPGYVAPEMWTAGVHGGYGNKVDVFSAGVTLYVLLCGYEPFYGESDKELIDANKAAIVDFPEEDWSRISLEARDLVEKMLERDPKKRISAKDALQHPWVTRRVTSKAIDTKTSLDQGGSACTIS